ncbi:MULTISPECIES: DUF6482 family protein [Pseudomonas]|uniref:Metal ABC transporter ATPase n=1 Tax=Pseudomonas gingeri TaxID=117681 RepID=A0A7Y7WLP1_9PSED|nr:MULTISPECIES: DUF6482 family protein [Pseudomonas]MPQ67863.1 metal ABC transporter ATPase [Pseudomonas sp. MWU12-2323]NWB83497.1 metal ABC transporter ATPase [Pseudomonas gingeri]
MNLQTLSEWAAEGRVQELELLSLEGGFYLLRARLEQGMRTLLDARGEVLRLRSTSHVRELLRELPSLPCVLVQHVVHDEMCGMRDGPIEPLRLPFSLTSPW